MKVRSVKKGFFSKNFNFLEKNKNRTIPNSIQKMRTRNSKSKVDTLKKELDFYQKNAKTSFDTHIIARYIVCPAYCERSYENRVHATGASIDVVVLPAIYV